jgi:rod shape-determining protein MreD
MRYLLWAFIIIIALLLQGSLSIFDVTPNITVLLVCYLGIKKGETKGMLIGALIGFIEDSLSASLLGTHLLSKGIIGYFSPYIYNKFLIWTPLLSVSLVCFVTVLDGSIVFLARSLFDKMPVSFGAGLLIITIQSLFNAPFGLILRQKNLE